MKPLFEKITDFLKREWFLFVMLIAISLIIFLFAACRLL
jgi:hypothetical protein